MRLRNLTGRLAIGPNSYLIESGDHRIILDSGMDPKAEGIEALPNLSAVKTDSVDAILVSHAHHDHIGSLPITQRRQPKAPVYMTQFTGEVGAAMLHNSVNVMTKQRAELGIADYPLFTHRELDEIHQKWHYLSLKKPYRLGGTELDCMFHDAGHICGSVGIQITEGDKSLFYTGDVSFDSQTLSMAADFPEQGVDVLIMETTRGDFARSPEYSRKAEKEKLAAIIRDTHAANGSVLIPVFALGKTQETMLMLHELQRMDLIPDMPLYIGGLSTKITEITDQYSSKTRRNYPGFSLMEDIDFLVASKKSRKKREIAYQNRCIYALSSGMMSENTASNAFARTFLDNPKNTVAFVGYTDPSTPGYRVRHAKKGDRVSLDERLPDVTVNARIESLDFSAHATREQLLAYVQKVNPKKVLLVHGDEPAQLWFQREIAAILPGTEVIRPVPDQWIELW